MSAEISRLFICIDEWLWLGLCLFVFGRWVHYRYCLLAHEQTYAATVNESTPKHIVFQERAWRYAFFAVIVTGAIFVYGVSYPLYWLHFGFLP